MTTIMINKYFTNIKHKETIKAKQHLKNIHKKKAHTSRKRNYFWHRENTKAEGRCYVYMRPDLTDHFIIKLFGWNYFWGPTWYHLLSCWLTSGPFLRTKTHKRIKLAVEKVIRKDKNKHADTTLMKYKSTLFQNIKLKIFILLNSLATGELIIWEKNVWSLIAVAKLNYANQM